MRKYTLVVFAGCAALFAADTFTQRQRDFWSFQKVKDQAPPPVRDRAWIRNTIDQFVLAKLEAKSLRPSPPADKVTVLRRATFDLTGLPPTPEEINAFLADKSPDAFSTVVDRLLASPRYGERWGRHWLDLARFAESEGFKADEPRANAWRYRDYVIQSFNSDKPYDRFVQEQIAGDEMWPDDPQARLATGFHRHYPDESNARNLFQRRQEILDDITDTTGAVFMGLTVGCARCHNHKFDPILHADYYRLQSFFANTAASDHIPMLKASELNEFRRKKAVWEAKTSEIREKIAAVVAPEKQKVVTDYFDKYPPEIQAMIRKSPEQRQPYESLMAWKAKPYLEIPDEESAKTLKGEAKKRYEELRKELAAFKDLDPGPLPEGMGVADLGRTAPATHILAVGNWERPKEEVQPGFLTLLDPNPAKIVPPANAESTGRRTALAKWLTDPENPLTPRVMANRIWHYHFGKGIVGSPSDFGVMGERPTHPELLDWLTREFVRSGWSMKHMHRLILNSAAWQQSSDERKDAAEIDPGNRLLWSYPRHRLEGEAIRDAALYTAGLLDLKEGGPSVYPELPDGMGALRGGWKVNAAAAERNRRSVYVFVKRNQRYPMLEAMDMPDTHESCPRRSVTTTAPQALTLVNDRVVLEWAQAFAARVKDVKDPVAYAFRLAYGRPPDSWEKDTAATFLARQSNISTTPLVDLCHMLLASNEFVYVN
jgi:hypothetical protein